MGNVENCHREQEWFSTAKTMKGPKDQWECFLNIIYSRKVLIKYKETNCFEWTQNDWYIIFRLNFELSPPHGDFLGRLLVKFPSPHGKFRFYTLDCILESFWLSVFVLYSQEALLQLHCDTFGVWLISRLFTVWGDFEQMVAWNLLDCVCDPFCPYISGVVGTVRLIETEI